MRSALESVFLIQYQLSINDSNKVTVSGQTYRKYYGDYLDELSHFAAQHNTCLKPNQYSNVLHDSVWDTAIALNISLEANFGTSKKIEVLEITGALRDVDNGGCFDNNGETEVAVNIFQIRNGTVQLYTVISNRQCNETATGRSPDDEIPRIYNLQSAAITAVLLTIEAVLIILTSYSHSDCISLLLHCTRD